MGANQSESGPDSRCPLCNSHGIFSFEGRDLLHDKPDTYRYMQCQRCSAVYQGTMPSPSDIAGFYPDDYEVYREVNNPLRHGRTKLAILLHKYHYTHLHVPLLFRLLAPVLAVSRYRDAISFVPNGRALDIGCGNGKFMRRMNSLGWRFEGVEFNPVAVDVCRRAGLKVFHGDLHAAAFEENSFDLVSARHLIEHVSDPDALMSEIARILKRGGRLVVRTPNSLALGRQWFGTYWYDNDVPRHLILFSPANLRMLAGRHGLLSLTEKTFTTPKIILMSWDYVTGNRDDPSKNRKVRRLIARFYVLLTAIGRRGDEIFGVYEKS